jgi:hypothetical protein
VGGQGGGRPNTPAPRFVAEKTHLVAFQKLWNASGAYGGVKTFSRFLSLTALLVVLSVVTTRAASSLDSALEAQARLGTEVWSQVIRIENKTPAKGYPKVVHALVFELADILWFYDGAHGTQSFSLHKGRLAEEKADFAPLLRDIHAGFGRWTVVGERARAGRERIALRNGCFIESVVALRERLALGGEVVRPKLLSYYLNSSGSLHGHTVLAYETGDRVEIIDSALANQRFNFPAPLAADAMKLAKAVAGSKVASARLFSLEPVVATGLFASAVAASSSVAVLE